MNTETIIDVKDHDADEIARRLDGCLGYLQSRIDALVDDDSNSIPRGSVQRLRDMLGALNVAKVRVLALSAAHAHRTEAAAPRE